MHEIGHAVGLYHEHQRSDRHRYVVVREDLSEEHDYEIKSDGLLLGDYDLRSIMHYGQKEETEGHRFECFDQNGEQTPNCDSGMGQRNGLSSGDIWAVRSMYIIP